MLHCSSISIVKLDAVAQCVAPVLFVLSMSVSSMSVHA